MTQQMDSGVVWVTGDSPYGERKWKKELKICIAWSETLVEQEGPIKSNLFSLSYSKKVLNLPYSLIWFHCIYWLLCSPVYPPQDYDATLAFISVKIQWEQQERPLPHSNPPFWECSTHALAHLVKKKEVSVCQGVRQGDTWSSLQC